jgi:RecA/RadA recombinase
MESSSSTIIDLRNRLATRFPHLRLGIRPLKPVESIATGIAALDSILGGGLPRGQFTELLARGNGSGSTEVLHAFLRHVALNRQFLALVDGAGSFDATAVETPVLLRLLWIRCRKASEALQATDLLLRDRNFILVVLDLKLNAPRELRQIVSSTWYRYARLLEQSQAAVLVITSQPLVRGVMCRISVESALGIDALKQPRSERLSCLRFEALRLAADREVLSQAG